MLLKVRYTKMLLSDDTLVDGSKFLTRACATCTEEIDFLLNISQVTPRVYFNQHKISEEVRAGGAKRQPLILIFLRICFARPITNPLLHDVSLLAPLYSSLVAGIPR